MRVVKSLRQSLLTRTFENEGKAYLVLTSLVCFSLPSPRSLVHEVSLWPFVAEALGPDAVLDEGMSKQRGEVLVVGSAFPPGGAGATSCAARLRLGSVDKELYVIGDRRWEQGAPSAPEPFREMPLTWARAFGGPGFAPNPLGRGLAPVTRRGQTSHPLPNIEDPRRLVGARGDRPEPAGFGPLDGTWPQRFSKVGTYDKEWLDTRFPGPAADFDWSYWNVAPRDQQLRGYFEGTEAFSLAGMHPDKPLVEGRLPGFGVRFFVTQRAPQEGDEESFREVPSRLDTVYLFPAAERGILVFRGVAEVGEDDAADVTHLVTGVEDLGAPRPADHYRALLARRLDKRRGAVHALSDKELLPDDLPPALADPLEERRKLIGSDNLLARGQRRRAEKQMAESREKLVAAGHEAPPFEMPPEEAFGPTDPAELPALLDRMEAVAEEAKQDAEQRRVSQEQEVRKQCAAQGLDYDEAVAAARERAGGPPKFSAEAELGRLRDACELHRNAGAPAVDLEDQLADGSLAAKLRKVEAMQRQAYLRHTHFFPAARSLHGEPAQALRDSVIEARGRGESLAGRDLTGADLSGLDLSGVDLREAMLESTDLSSATLAGADLTGATLARADLSRARLDGARLQGTNFGCAKLRGASLQGGVDLTAAIFWQSDLSGANLRGATLGPPDPETVDPLASRGKPPTAGAQFWETTLDGADLGEVKAARAQFIDIDFTGVSFAGADLRAGVFLRCKLAGVNLGGADLTKATFVGCDLEGADLRGATLERVSTAMGTSFAGANLAGARMARINLRGADLAGADLSGADLEASDLSEADLHEANLQRVTAPDALFVRTNFTRATLRGVDMKRAILQKSRIEGADLRGANLFRADLAKVRGDDATDLSGALVEQVRFVKRRPDAKG